VSHSVYVELLNRRQNHLQLVLYDVSCFVLSENVGDSMVQDAVDDASMPGSVWIVKDESSAYWVNVSSHFLLFVM